MNIPVKFVDQTEKIETRVEDFVPIYGKSAYQIALDNGFVGTEEEWLDSLHGEDGYTPQKGIDYFTEADISEVAQRAAELVDVEVNIEVDSELSETSTNPVENKAVYAEFGNKADKRDPVLTGSFSMNRMANSAIGEKSHAEGDMTTASGKYSHAEGQLSKATAHCGHAEGYSTNASASCSHAEGYITTAKGSATHAEGYGTIAKGSNQHVQGKYNIEDTTSAHIVGNGESDTERSNAHTLDWDGNAWFAGTVDCAGLKVNGQEFTGGGGEGGSGADVIMFYSGSGADPSMTFEEALAAIEAGRSLVAYYANMRRAYTLQYWEPSYIVFLSKTQHEMAETGIWEKFIYRKDNTWETEYLGLDAFSFGTVTTNEDGTLSCDKGFMDLLYDDLSLGKVIGLAKKDATEATIYYYSKMVLNESTGGTMAVFGSPTGKFLGLGADNSVVELTDYSVYVDWNNIHNKPFGDAITLVDNRTFANLLDDGTIIITPTLKLEEGKKYTVTYNGATFETTAIAFNDIPEFGSGVGVGNGAAFGFPNTGEPFIIGYVPAIGVSSVIPLDGSTEVTLTVIRDLEVIDEKYLPGTVATKAYVEQLLLVDETEVV